MQVIYVTVDPERDDVAQLKKYLGNFDRTFIGGTGTPDQLAAVRKAYGISAEKVATGDSYSYSHSSFHVSHRSRPAESAHSCPTGTVHRTTCTT